MSDVMKLLKKDISILFKINRKGMIIMLYPIFMNSVILTSRNMAVSYQMVGASITYAVYIIVVGFLATEEKCGTAIIFESLPIKRMNLIIEKYIFAIMAIVGFALIGCIFPTIKAVMEKDISIFYMSMFSAMIYGVFVLSIFLPVYYKYGYAKFQSIYIIIFFGLVLAPMLLNYASSIAAFEPITHAIYTVLDVMMQNPANAIISCVIMYIVSMAVSIYIK